MNIFKSGQVRNQILKYNFADIFIGNILFVDVFQW